MANDKEVSCLLKVTGSIWPPASNARYACVMQEDNGNKMKHCTDTHRHMYAGHRRSAYMSTDSPAEGMSPPLYVSLAAGPVTIPLPPAVTDVINNIDDDCASCGCCCDAGGLQYLYWFFICCENEPE